MKQSIYKMLPRAACAAAALFALASTQGAYAAESDAEEIRLLREQVALLQKRLDALEAKQTETAKQVASTPAPAKDAAIVTIGNKGPLISSPDKKYTFEMHTRIQYDGHFFPDNADGRDEFYLRRAIISFRGQMGPAFFRLSPNFASSFAMEDAWIEMSFSKALRFTAGKILSLEGHENVQNNAHLLFSERSLANNMTPGREIGVKLDGKPYGWLQYGVSVTNGALDSQPSNNNANLSDEMLLSGLVLLSPFAADKESPLAGLTFGASASIGNEDVTLDGTTDKTMRYSTAGRNAFLTIQNGTHVYGQRYRINPQLRYYLGSFGLLSEYMYSSYEMNRGGVEHTIGNSGFTVQASYILTGEKNGYALIKPNKPFNLKGEGWGAFEVGMRYNFFKGDEDLFAGNASTMLASTTSVQKASSIGAMVKWHMSENLMWALNYEVTDFSGKGIDKNSEQALITRMQLDF